MRCIIQFGDVHPLDYGGTWVLIDDGGRVEVECLVVPDTDRGKYLAYRFTADQCTYHNGVLSDNPFHPSFPAWFASGIENVQGCCGTEPLIESLCSADPITRAESYLSLASYYGLHEFDSYPLELNRREAVARYNQHQYQEPNR